MAIRSISFAGSFLGVCFRDWCVTGVLYSSIYIVLVSHSIGYLLSIFLFGVGVVEFRAITIGMTTASHGGEGLLEFCFFLVFLPLNRVSVVFSSSWDLSRDGYLISKACFCLRILFRKAKVGVRGNFDLIS